MKGRVFRLRPGHWWYEVWADRGLPVTLGPAPSHQVALTRCLIAIAEVAA